MESKRKRPRPPSRPRKKLRLITTLRASRKLDSIRSQFDFTNVHVKTPEKIKKVLEAFEQGATYRQAAQCIGVSHGTLLKWRIRDPELDKAIEKAKMSRVRLVEDALTRNALVGFTGNVEAQKFFLKNRASHDWKDKQEHEHTGDIHLVYGHRKPQKETAEVKEKDE